MIRVLFVCLGNICRSPMAEAVFRHKVKERGLENHITVDSAGTSGWHVGEPPHRGTCEMLDLYSIDYERIAARQIRSDDMQSFHYIVAMDAENLGVLHRMAGFKETGHVARLLDFVAKDGFADVPDPYYTGNFQETYDLVEEGCEKLLAFIREREGI